MSDSLVFSVQGGLEAGAAARRAISTGNGWLPDSLRDDILLLVTELVTNAVEHGQVGPHRSANVGINQSPDRVRVEVVDAGLGFHPDGPLPGGAAGGWGLYLVDRVADRWGVLPAASGTCVWFEIESRHPSRGWLAEPQPPQHERTLKMADKPVFLYAAVYDEIADAEADYEAVFDLHAAGAIGTFDSAVIRKEPDGKVRVTKTEKPTQHGGWTGAGVGALVGILFPPAILGSAIVGAGAGALTGHLTRGISRGDLKDLGEALDEGTAAVIVIGESKIEEQLERATKRAKKLLEKQVDADAEELKREIEAAEREGAAT